MDSSRADEFGKRYMYHVMDGSRANESELKRQLVPGSRLLLDGISTF
jgi:hypothetical protein